MKQEMDFSRAFGRADKEFVYCVQSTLEGLKNQEERKVKKKLSVGAIVIAALLILTMGTALALTVGWGHIEKAMDLMVEKGAYWEWDLDAKMKLIEAMKADGVALPTDDLRRLEDQALTDKEKEALIDRLLEENYGDHEFLYYYTFAEKEWGEPQTWTLEQRHWFWNTLREKGLYGDNSWIDLLPEKGDLKREEAVRIARKAVADAYELTDEEIEAYYPNVSFFITDAYQTPRWMIEFHPLGENGHIFGGGYMVLLTREGEVTEDWEGVGVLTPEHARAREEEQAKNDVNDWAVRSERKLNDMETVYYNPAGGTYYHFLENCPLVKEEYLPLTEISKTDPVFGRLSPCPVCVYDQVFWTVEDKIRYVCGAWQMPEEDWITEEKAVEIAKEALEKQGAELDGLHPAVFSGTEGEAQKIYQVYFSAVSLDEDGHFGWDPAYSAVIDAITGEIVTAGEAGSNG